jgi:hypothetical protein
MAIKRGNKRFQGTLDPLHQERLARIKKVTGRKDTDLLCRWIDQEYTLVTQWNKKIPGERKNRK